MVTQPSFSGAKEEREKKTRFRPARLRVIYRRFHCVIRTKVKRARARESDRGRAREGDDCATLVVVEETEKMRTTTTRATDGNVDDTVQDPGS